MDLVDEQQRRAAVGAARARRLENLLQLGDAGVDRRDLDEFGLRLLADQPRHRGLAGARRAPEDHRAEARRGEHARQRAFRSGQMLLPRDFVEGLRPQPLRQRRRRSERREQIGTAAQRRPLAKPSARPCRCDGGALPTRRRRTMLGRSIDPPGAPFCLRRRRPSLACRPPSRKRSACRAPPWRGSARRWGAKSPPAAPRGVSTLVARHGRVAYAERFGAAEARRPADAGRRDLPHLFDDQADRLRRGDDPGRGGTAAAFRPRRQIPARLRRDEGRRRTRRRARARPRQAADHDPRPDAPHLRV